MTLHEASVSFRNRMSMCTATGAIIPLLPKFGVPRVSIIYRRSHFQPGRERLNIESTIILPYKLVAMSGSAVNAESSGANNVPVAEERPTARVVLTSGDDHDAGDRDDDEAGDAVADADEDDDENFLENYPDETTELDLWDMRITSLAPLRLQRFAGHLTRLVLRKNLIQELDPEIFQPLTKLEHLDLYDNKIKHVGDALNNLISLEHLDLSFNVLREIPETLSRLTALQIVFFVQNRISHITGLQGLGATLTSLELGANRIRRIEGLDALVNLKELWLGKNKITRIENLDNLKQLTILSLQSNRITKIENLEKLENLEQLLLSHNGIERLEGLERNTKLKMLDVGSNFISAIENVSHLTSLEDLWLGGNKIPDLHALEPQLRHISALETIYLEANPCQSTEGANYMRKIRLALPHLTQIDATYL